MMMKPDLKIFFLAALAVTLAAAPAPAEEASPLDFTATALDGSQFSGRSIEGKAVLLDFWGSWCAPCIHAFPTLQRLHGPVGTGQISGEGDERAQGQLTGNGHVTARDEHHDGGERDDQPRDRGLPRRRARSAGRQPVGAGHRETG